MIVEKMAYKEASYSSYSQLARIWSKESYRNTERAGRLTVTNSDNYPSGTILPGEIVLNNARTTYEPVCSTLCERKEGVWNVSFLIAKP